MYIRSFLPELARLTQIAVSSNDQTHQTLLINMLRTLGTLINNASMDSIRNYVFYRDLVELKYVP